MWVRFAAVQISRALLIILIAGLFGAALVRFSPGFDTDERDLDLRLSAATHQADQAARAANHNLLAFYTHWITAAARGDLGQSRTMNRPVRELIGERLPVTARLLVFGALPGMLAGLTGAALIARRRSWVDDLLAPVNGLLLSAPPAVVALLFLWLDLDPALALGIAVCPYVFRYAANLLREAATAPHVISGRARGLSPMHVFFWHVFLPSAPQLAALAGIAATVAFGAAIPVEVICDRAGIGQLAWQAALGRDMPVLVAVTMLITVLIVVVNALAEILLVSSAAARAPEAR